MIKKIAALFILVSFMAQTFSKAAIVGNYYLNTADYAKNCINKAKPKLHCNGKCQMMKKLKQEEKKDTQNPERRSNVKNQVLSSKSHFASIPSFQNNLNVQFSDLPPSFTKDRAIDIFHPPGV
jgi:hypothetical protein